VREIDILVAKRRENGGAKNGRAGATKYVMRRGRILIDYRRGVRGLFLGAKLTETYGGEVGRIFESGVTRLS
jgi:hypothetical protein